MKIKNNETDKVLVRVSPKIKKKVDRFVFGQKLAGETMTIGRFYDEAAEEKLKRENTK